jgi:EpsD family peptidyl-prolyl cis-trans isomerase
MSHTRLNRPVLASCLLLALAGLGPAANAEAEKPPETVVAAPPVVAVVNGVGITRKELDYLYVRTSPPNLPAELALARKRAILTELISNEALAQKAIEAELDKTPEFAMEMELARRSALAEKVERQLVRKGPQVTPQNALDYVNTNPEMFAERQLLTLERMDLVKTDEELLDKLDKASDNGANLQRLEKLAQESRAETKRQVFNSYSDRLEPQLLKAMLTKPYKPVVIKFNDDKTRSSVFYVHSALPAPLTGQQALRAAGLALMSKQAQASRLQGRQAIVGAAKVSFYGEFAGTALPAATADGEDLKMAQLFTKPFSFERKLAVASGLAAATTLLVLTLLTALRYWKGGSSQPGTLRQTLQAMPLLGRLFGKSATEDELARVLAASSARPSEEQTSWYGKLLVLVLLAGCSALLLVQLSGAWQRLQHWQIAVTLAAGLLAGTLSGLIYVRSRLRDIQHERRWIPVSVTSALLMGVSAAAIVIN